MIATLSRMARRYLLPNGAKGSGTEYMWTPTFQGPGCSSEKQERKSQGLDFLMPEEDTGAPSWQRSTIIGRVSTACRPFFSASRTTRRAVLTASPDHTGMTGEAKLYLSASYTDTCLDRAFAASRVSVPSWPHHRRMRAASTQSQASVLAVLAEGAAGARRSCYICIANTGRKQSEHRELAEQRNDHTRLYTGVRFAE